MTGPAAHAVLGPSGAQAVHSRLYRAYGMARDRACIECGKPARDWAYQYSSADEQVDAFGQRWSENLDDYAPMCRRCHVNFDRRVDPAMAERVDAKHRAVDPELRRKAGRASIAQRPDTAVAMQRRTCECGYESNAGNVAQHRRRLNHTEAS